MRPTGTGRGTDSSGTGDPFDRWYRAHYIKTVAKCVSILRDQAAAEDIAQEALLRAWVNRANIREEDLGAWLVVVARNLCISYLRVQKRNVPVAAIPEATDDAADPVAILQRKETVRAIRRAIEGLGHRHRSALYLRHFEEVDSGDVEAELGLTAEGTRSLLFRARRMMREKLVAVGEGVAAIVAGIKVRVHAAVGRARNGSQVAFAQATPAALNVVVAIGLTAATLGGGALFGAANASAALPGGLPAASNRATGGSSAVSIRSSLGSTTMPTTSTQGKTRIINDPSLEKPSTRGHVYSPNDGSSDIDIRIAGQHIEYRGWREPGTDNPLVYRAEDTVLNPTCHVVPSACAAPSVQQSGGKA